MQKCNSCGGVYEPVLPDGSRYFHSCAPIVGVAVTRGGAAQVVPLSDLRATDTVNVVRAGKSQAVAVAALLETDVRIGDVALPRPNARDENVDSTKAEAVIGTDGARVKGTPDEAVMKSAGAGVTKL
jgi:hypothetical protein